MKKKDIVKQLIPGVIVGLILGFGLTMLVGVNKKEALPNYIGGGMCCLIPTLLNCIVVLKGTAKQLKRKISLKDTFIRALPLSIINFIIGVLVVIIGVEKIINISSCDLSITITSIYQSILGVITSTTGAYIALKRYESQVKYTKRLT